MPELAVVTPTFNESLNVEPLLAAIARALPGIDFEVIFVDDDSPDHTADLARSISLRDPRVRVVHRVGRRGLSSAVIEGMMSTSAPYIAVIDADMQHDEQILPKMLALLKDDHLDLVIGTRNAEGGGMGEFSKERVTLSDWGRRLSRLVTPIELSDPMSGFFLIDRRFLNEVVRDLSGSGFKILLDLVASARRPVRVGEVGYVFRNRLRGETKLNILVGLEYIELLLDKLIGRWIPVRYAIFAGVGTVGAVAHLILVTILIELTGTTFETAQWASSSFVIALNFFLNNALTFRAKRLRGAAMAAGLALFYVACLAGLWMNLQIATALRSNGTSYAVAAVAGLAVGSVWNYWVSLVGVWRARRRS